MKSPHIPNDRPRQESPAKAYSKPHVQVYGDLKGLTRSVDMSGLNDNGMGNDKT